jgi:hypothetical protein
VTPAQPELFCLQEARQDEVISLHKQLADSPPGKAGSVFDTDLAAIRLNDPEKLLELGGLVQTCSSPASRAQSGELSILEVSRCSQSCSSCALRCASSFLCPVCLQSLHNCKGPHPGTCFLQVTINPNIISVGPFSSRDQRQAFKEEVCEKLRGFNYLLHASTDKCTHLARTSLPVATSAVVNVLVSCLATLSLAVNAANNEDEVQGLPKVGVSRIGGAIPIEADTPFVDDLAFLGSTHNFPEEGRSMYHFGETVHLTGSEVVTFIKTLRGESGSVTKHFLFGRAEEAGLTIYSKLHGLGAAGEMNKINIYNNNVKALRAASTLKVGGWGQVPQTQRMLRERVQHQLPKMWESAKALGNERWALRVEVSVNTWQLCEQLELETQIPNLPWPHRCQWSTRALVTTASTTHSSASCSGLGRRRRFCRSSCSCSDFNWRWLMTCPASLP